MTPKALSQVLALDAATCVAVFALGVFATATVAELTGLPGQIAAAGGWICLAAAALLAYLAVRPSRGLLWLTIAGNVGWVAASLAVWLAYFDSLTPLGHAIVLAQAAGVALFVMLESRGARSITGRQAIA
ncbi:MAG TPA: hypothetical protein VFS87_03985 [Qipengyuania sp.]|nr:hypothetical protein [Qipengyuania sp.]